MMTDIRWETFEGTHFEVGRKLGHYWVRRLEACRKSVYGRRFLKKYHEEWLAESQITQEHKCLLGTLERHFPSLVEEIEGMAQGAKDKRYKASFGNLPTKADVEG
jgi:hypothetical protein